MKASRFSSIITVLHGLSFKTDLPRSVDIIVHELIGDIATEEGAGFVLYYYFKTQDKDKDETRKDKTRRDETRRDETRRDKTR